jgi:hypothetical protein
VITADLDRELASALRAAGDLPFTAGTWRPAPGGDPASYSTTLAFRAAWPTGLAPGELAATLAGPLREVPWIRACRLAGDGHLTIEVTAQALAASAAAMAAAGPSCAASTILEGCAVSLLPWPDLAAQPGWPGAWHAQAGAMAGRLAAAAGAAAVTATGQKGGGYQASAIAGAASPVSAAVAYFGPDAVRYWLARTATASGPWPEPGRAGGPAHPFYAVGQARTEAVSTLRWAGDLGVDRVDPGDQLAGLLAAPAQRALLGLLSFLPVRVAAAARRGRSDELPRYLEQVGLAWLECHRSQPALPFGGRAAPPPGDQATVSARLLLAEAAGAVLTAGLGLAGVAAAAGRDVAVGVSGTGT